MNTVLEFYEAIREEYGNPILRTVNSQEILNGNPVAKNIYVAVYGDGMIKSSGFDMYLYEIKYGKITHAKIKQAFKEIGFTEGLNILTQVKRSADLDALDMAYYQLDEVFEACLIEYLQRSWNDPEFMLYCDSISFKQK
ncbi:hypothetical protein [Chryseobacterium sp. 2987]|uniref:DMP19 family protein n=1 Tax=Chryseobacterium sp. 2987 TaxID=2817767 RepID=UPI00286361B5|nr:hypothetical protein [Chryseobacterium sp. 2987]MDR6919736.1 3-deoxy-D-manno-octulosonic acid (KDO) 8-phosphate synthase [Chryseobacterium sp. 2987]